PRKARRRIGMRRRSWWHPVSHSAALPWRPMRRFLDAVLTLIAVLAAAGCAGMPGAREPLQVSVAGIESISSEDLEARMMVKLRVQNPNDAPVEYDGVYVKLDVMGKTLATGVSDERGAVPRFGESVIEVP